MKNTQKNRGIFNARKTFLIVFLLLLVPLFGLTCSAGTAEDYAPILYFEGEETCYPIGADYATDNSVKLSATIANQTISYYDNTHGTIHDNGVVSHYQSMEDLYPNTIYYYEYTDTDSLDVIVQYWMYYAFNPGEHNQHEGDWEMVQVVIPTGEEKWAAYSQHYSGQRAAWDQVEKQGDHMKVYVSRGSHANYFRPFSGKLGIASDIVAANGKVLEPADYTLVDISTQTWLNDAVLWGELASTEQLSLGSDGTPGPMFRTDMYGTLMSDGLNWGSNLNEATNYWFIGEMFMYHLMTIIIILTIVILIVIIVKIYLRHKKYGLGPRIVSMFYIDGINLHTIGNILCIIAIILAIVGLYNNWYLVSADIQSDVFNSGGMTDVISINGIDGIQMYMPGPTGTTPLGSAVVPYTYIILIGIIFMILSTIGVHLSKKLGSKYLLRGVRFIAFIVVLIIAILLLGLLAGPMGGSSESESGAFVTNMLESISGSPLGGQLSDTITQEGITAQINMEWGLGIGAIMLLLAGILILVAGILEKVAKRTFFEPKIPIEKPAKEKPKAKEPEPAKEGKKESKAGFCPECGAKLEKGDMFCPDCGTKME